MGISEMQKHDRIWEPRSFDPKCVKRLASELGLSSITARLLCLRGINTSDQAKRFLSPSIDYLHNPLILADMETAVERILLAIEQKELIVVHGDYDVDGVTSTVLLRRTLELLGADVMHFLPERLKDGYGLRPAVVERLHAQGARLIISVDCGINASEAALMAKSLGVDLIITDHHEPDLELPEALAVINPKRSDCNYPDRNLAGVGVTLKLVQAICDKTGHHGWLPSFLKIAAIGTLADVVPLTGENRVIAKLGLDLLSKGPHTVGLRSLIEICGLAEKKIDSYQIGFVLAPRVNAAGRMSTPDIAAKLLLLSDDGMVSEARALAKQLDDENLKRRKEEAEILEQAIKLVESNKNIGKRSIIVVAAKGWHRGVIGIVASRLVGKFSRPSIVLSIDGSLAYGSCRSIASLNILEALKSCGELMIQFGGHTQAAGLEIEAAKIDDFRNSINKFAELHLKEADFEPRLSIDASLSLSDISESFLFEIEKFAPFGAGNPRPVFQARNVQIVDGPRRLKGQHLKVGLSQGGRSIRGIAWRAAEKESLITANRNSIDVAFSISKNVWNGQSQLQLEIADFRAPSDKN